LAIITETTREKLQRLAISVSAPADSTAAPRLQPAPIPARKPAARELRDAYGRVISYLRVSVTDRCNLRCVYCMPPEGIELFPKESVLTLEELLRVVKIGVSLGIRKVRVTGGEPTVRNGLPTFIAGLHQLDGLEQIAMTTNGLRLAELAPALRDAGMRSINVSIDSLDPDRFRTITRGGELWRVLDGIDTALSLGIRVKTNTVVLADMNDAEAVDFARFAFERGIDVRFIEFMPLCGNGWRTDLVVPLSKVQDAIAREFSLRPEGMDGVADMHALEGGRGRVGFITTMSHPFCSECSRMRLTARGGLRPCLFSPLEVDIFPLLRGGASDDAVAEAFQKTASIKPESNPHLAGGKDAAFVRIRNVGG
jgi:cyclic pyranopterin phosphate synthase